MGRNPAPIITTFPQASLRSRTVGFPESGSDLGSTPRSPSQEERSLSADSHTPQLVPVYFQGRSSCSPALCPATPGTTKCPEPLRAFEALPLPPWPLRPPSAGVTPPSSLLQAHASVLLPPTAYGHSLGQQVFAGCRQPRLGCRTFPALPPRILPQMPGPLPRRSLWCTGSFLPTGHRPSPFPNWVGTPRDPAQRRQCGHCFRGCSHSLMFRPPGLLATQVVPTAA